MRTAAWIAAFWVAAASAQTFSTRCGTEEVPVGEATIDLRLAGCGDEYPDDVLWHLDRADSPAGALDGTVTRRATGRGAVVYMCDTGVMQSHDEFVRPDGSVVIAGIDVNPNPNGKCVHPAVDPCFSSDGTLSIFTHGSAAASVIAGRNTGIAPDAKIVSVYMMNVGTSVDLWIRTLDAIIQNAWDPATPQFSTAIVNMSFTVNLASAQDPKFSRFEKKMRAMIGGVDRDGNPDPYGKRFLFVTAAGNHTIDSGNQCDANRNTNLYPAVLGSSIDGLITVGGVDRENHVWDESCRGDAVDVLAPATDLLVASISAHDHYRSGHAMYASYPGNSGTSYAAPYVSGLAALLLEENPALTPAELENILKSTASHVADPEEKTAMGRVAVFDLVSGLPRHRLTRR